ncbi:MAG: hypothetical protein DHS20C16_13050 [Phycisphaerae bacterium]|nr:MAG: hypothetical protein DHS20C16_13050 [Phycisphaerae bacterium]
MAAGATQLCAQVSPDNSEAESKSAHDIELLDAWDKIAVRIKNREPWDLLSAELHAVIERYYLSEYVGPCQQLLASIDAVIKSPPPSNNINDESEVPDLIKALPNTSMLHRLAISPNVYYESIEQFVWDYYAERMMTFVPDPAMAVYSRGSSAIDPLIECLNDNRATRSVGTSEDGYRQPIVVRVCDVALALIEGISGCTFKETQGGNYLISEWTSDDRNRLERAIRKWRGATKSMSPEDAIVWQIENGPEKQRIQMIDTLIARKQGNLAMPFMQNAYKESGGENIAQIANRMVKAGSREPLDHIHQLTKSDGQIRREMILLIAHFGEARDFQMLVRLVASASPNEGRASAQRVQMIVESLRAAKDRRAMMAVPVHVAVIRSMKEEWTSLLSSSAPRRAFPPILDMSIYAIQNASGLGFGMNEDSDTFDRARACKSILTWWDEEGEGAYGLEQNKPHAPVGIR